MILPMTSWYNSYVLATDIINLWYWGRLISFFLWYCSLYHGTWATGRRGLGAPLASRSTPVVTFKLNIQTWIKLDAQHIYSLAIQVGCLRWLLSGQGHSAWGLRPGGHPAAGSPPGRLGVTDRRSLAPTGNTVSEGSSVQSITGLELVHER